MAAHTDPITLTYPICYINGYYCIRSVQKLQKHMEYLDAAEKE